jgi:hypothetical protein
MDENSLIVEINKILKYRWSKKQLTQGKWIEMKWEWAVFIRNAVHKYKECGWEVSKQVEISPTGRRIWLVFINPHWRRGVLKELPH